MNPHEKYQRDVAAISRSIATWHRDNPAARPSFRFLPVPVAGSLAVAPQYWQPNVEGLALLRYVGEATAHATMLQFQSAYEHHCASR